MQKCTSLSCGRSCVAESKTFAFSRTFWWKNRLLSALFQGAAPLPQFERDSLNHGKTC